VASQQFVDSLRNLKAIVVHWSIKYKKNKEKIILDIEYELEQICDGISLRLNSLVDANRVQQLESTRHNILIEQEKAWRLNNQALWLEVRDLNPKFFQRFTNYHKSYNTIWELRDENDTKF